jgi:hypothetical protein
MVLLATIPMAGIAAALLVGANVVSQFIVSVIPYYNDESVFHWVLDRFKKLANYLSGGR